jgi:1,4-alpha-glucan branching enzyme
MPPSRYVWDDAQWMERRGETSRRDRPIAIYEVQLASWRRKASGEMLTYRELADTLVPYVRDLGFTHIEMLPITEHPNDGSWGYQTTGMFAPTSRHGSPDDLRAFIDRAHAQGIGVIWDWVPGHFPADTHGLVYFDGTQLYEHADLRKSFHVEWGTYSYNFDRNGVANFLIASALFWLEQFHIDGLRVDAVSSMVYLDYGRGYDEWLPNTSGGNENLEASAFLRRFNTIVNREFPSAMTIAEESTAFPKVSWPADSGGLGFGYKWNMGWMHDTLNFFSADPRFRGNRLNELSFGIWYAWTESFILPFSHNEVVHLKRSLLGRMPGIDRRRFASLRALYAYMYIHPGKKLIFMGGELAQASEWSEAGSLEWDQLSEDSQSQAVHALVRDLNRFYRKAPELYSADTEPAGFEWISCTDAANAVIPFLRPDPKSSAFLAVILNASEAVRQDYRVGVPESGTYQVRLNTGGNLRRAQQRESERVYRHGARRRRPSVRTRANAAAAVGAGARTVIFNASGLSDHAAVWCVGIVWNRMGTGCTNRSCDAGRSRRDRRDRTEQKNAAIDELSKTPNSPTNFPTTSRASPKPQRRLFRLPELSSSLRTCT